MSKYDISIIIPAFNQERHISKCIDSALNQENINTEIIIIDDGSTDNTLKICQEYSAKHSNIIVIHQDNSGLATARNTGLDIARGEWISWIDSDDWIEPNMYELLLQKCNNTSAEMVSYNYFNETEKGSILIIHDITIGDFDIIENLLHNKLDCTLWLSFIKRELFHDIRFVEEINIGEDLLVSIKLFMKKPKRTQISEALYHYRATNDNSIMRSPFSKEKCQQLVRCVGLIEKLLEENSLYQEHIAGIIARRKYAKFKILYTSSLFTSISFYELYPNLSKHIKILSVSDLFHKMILFNTEIKNIPIVWLCLGFYKVFRAIRTLIQ